MYLQEHIISMLLVFVSAQQISYELLCLSMPHDWDPTRSFGELGRRAIYFNGAEEALKIF